MKNKIYRLYEWQVTSRIKKESQPIDDFRALNNEIYPLNVFQPLQFLETKVIVSNHEI